MTRAARIRLAARGVAAGTKKPLQLPIWSGMPASLKLGTPGKAGNDDKHFNYWEDWFRKAYKVEEFSAFNTLWLTYFIAGGIVSGENQRLEFSPFVFAVAEGLLLAQAAGAVCVFLTGNQLDVLGCGRSNFGKIHN